MGKLYKENRRIRRIEQEKHPRNRKQKFFVESLIVFGDNSKIRECLLELLRTELDELKIGLIPISDATQETLRLAKIIGQL